ncbi:hypothetical protein H5965_45860, partial [Amycolatopsis sp. 505]|nr:hypothetical protein [Amycolatopsis sp. 505]
PQQPSFTDYTPPALATGGGSSGAGATGATPATSWIPVDHPATTPSVPAPAPAPSIPAPAAGHADEVVIHTNLTPGESTVEAPGGQDFDLDIDLDFNGKHFSQH